MQRNLAEYYRWPNDSEFFTSVGKPSGQSGFFRFGAGTTCYGQCSSGPVSEFPSHDLYDASNGIHFEDAKICLPFDSAQIIGNLRRERYAAPLFGAQNRLGNHASIRKMYYAVRGLLPISVRRHIQRFYFNDWQEFGFPKWPVDHTVDTLHETFLRLLMQAEGVRKIPFIWFWPDGAGNCLIMTHDVETSTGRNRTRVLMDLDQSYGIKASFQVVPEGRYEVSHEYVDDIRGRGFEFNVHDLSHDGSLFRERKEFLRRAARINEYTRKYKTRGFRSGAMYRNQDWYDAFEFSYDMSVPCVGHLEPQRGGCCTVMPYFIGNILEIPLTAAQDYSLFHILNDYSIRLWKEQFAVIKHKHGLLSFIVHPDYIFERRALRVYEDLLEYLRNLIVNENVWMALPGDVDWWWRARNQMKLVPQGNTWTIEGPGKEHARLAYAHIKNGQLEYEVM